MIVLAIPSPSQGVWHLGPFPVRAYAVCIIAGIVVATWLAERRWKAQGGTPGAIVDLLVWAVPGGVVGARLYHVLTNPELYFAAGRDPVRALYVWNGGLGIWGAIAGGTLAAYVAARRQNLSFPDVLRAATPALPLAQAIGRLGNYFNQELFGRPTGLPWGLEIDPDRRPDGYEKYSTFHPTFLYEGAWDIALAGVLIWCGRRWQLSGPRLFCVYVMGYTAGRFWIEALRIDPANRIMGLRLNEWTSVTLFLIALTALILSRRSTSRRDATAGRLPREPDARPDVAGDVADEAEPTPGGRPGQPDRESDPASTSSASPPSPTSGAGPSVPPPRDPPSSPATSA